MYNRLVLVHVHVFSSDIDSLCCCVITMRLRHVLACRRDVAQFATAAPAGDVWREHLLLAHRARPARHDVRQQRRHRHTRASTEHHRQVM